MKTTCNRCHCPVTGQFREGHYHFSHCGKTWSVAAKNYGNAKTGRDGVVAGAALGAVGAIASALNPLGGLLVGALVGSAFNSDNRRTCHKCGGAAYPTGRRGRQGDLMYQCNAKNCRAFTFVRQR
jgi:hypothetical protein